MTRDPSDGSIREKPAIGKFPTTEMSGLPINKAKADYLERLERSRDWLSKYRTDPEGVARRSGEQGE